MPRSVECDGFPDLTTNSTVMATCLRSDSNLYDKYQNVKTLEGYSFDDHIQLGVDDPLGRGCGCCCLEEDSYKRFHEFYHTLICTHQVENEPISSTACHRLNVLNLEDYRYSIDYNYVKDVQVQTRRNVSGFRFSPKCSRAERRKIFSIVEEAIQVQYPESSGLTHLYDISLERKKMLQAVGEFLEKPDKRSLCCRSGGSRDWPDGRGVVFTPDTSVSVWVNEEDNIRIFARETEKCTNIVNVLERVADCDVYLEKSLCDIGGWSYMHDSHFGYLTTDPTKLGVLGIKVTIQTVAIHGQNTCNALLQLCNKFKVDLHYDPDDKHSSLDDLKPTGIMFDLITRPSVFSSEDDRVGRFLECVKAIIRLDEHILLHGDHDADCFLSHIITSPVEYSWCKVRSDSCQSGESVPSSRGAMSLLSAISPRHWSMEKAETVKDSTCSGFCCLPSLQGGIMVSDPSSNTPMNREGGGLSITRKRRVSYDDNVSNINSMSTNGDDKRDRQVERDKDRQSQFYSKYSSSSNRNNDGDNPDNLDSNEKNQTETTPSLHRRYTSNLPLLSIVTDSISATSSSLKKRMGMGMGGKYGPNDVNTHSKSSNDCHSQNDYYSSSQYRSHSQSDLHSRNYTNCQENNEKSDVLGGNKFAVISDDEGEEEKESEGMGQESAPGQISPFQIEKRNMKQILSDVSDFPFFPRGATSLLSRYLTREIYNEYEDRRTSTSNCSLPELIRPGTENPKLRIGVVAGDEECYQTFSSLFDPIISGLHNFVPGSSSQLRDAQPMKLDGILGIDMSYTKAAGVQASRNIRGFPLAMRITRFERRKLEILLKNILERLSGPFKGKYFKLAELNRRQRKLLDDRHVRFDKPAVHTALALSGCNRDWPDGRGVFINDDMNFIVLTNHSDHLLVVSCDDSVGDLKAVFQRWSVGMMILEGYLNNTPIPTKSATQSSNTKTLKNNDEDMTQRKHLKKTVTRRHIFERNEEEDSFIKDQEESIRYYEFQYSDRLGYVACSPQNLGSGLYSTITLELSELGEHEDSLKVVCEKMGLRAVHIPPTLIDKNDNQEEKSNDTRENEQNNGVQNCNDGTEERERNKDGQDEDEEEEDGKGVGEKRRGKEEGEDSQEDNVRNEGGAITKIKHIKGVEEEMKTSYEDQKIGGNDGRNKTGKEERKKNTKKDRIINNARKGYEENVTTNGGNMNTFRLDQPILKTIYNISNIDCMGQSEVQLTQKVIDGVAAIIEIEKKIKDGSRIDDFLSIPATPPLPAPPLRKMSSGATLALITESIL